MRWGWTGRFPVGLKRCNRLRRRTDFLRAYGRGRVVHGRLLTVFVYERHDGKEARIGLTVTKKLGKSVTRNRLRRQLRECARMTIERVAPGLDIVINAKHPAIKGRFADLAEALAAALRKGQALRS